MIATVADIMTSRIVTARPHHTIAHVRSMMKKNKIHAVPIEDADGGVAGIVTAKDLADGLKADTPINQIMTERVYTIPQYNGIHQAARLMRNHRINHVVVTHEKKIVGILSSFDLLKLVEDHRFTMKAAAPKSTAKRKVA
jgi:CBS domain-containing protein